MKRALGYARYVLFFGIGVLLLWLAFRNQDKNEIIEGFRSANYWWVFVSFLFMMLSHWSRAARWSMLIKPLGYKVKHSHTFIAVMLGYLANLAIPRMGEVSRCLALNRSDKVPVNQLIGTVVTERVFDLISLLLIVFLVFILEFERLKNFLIENILPGLQKLLPGSSGLWLLGILIILGISGILVFRHLSQKHRENPIISKLRSLIKGFYDGIKTIRKMDNNLAFLGHTVFIWFSYFAMTYVMFFAFDSTSKLDISAGLSIFAIGSMGFVMPVQGGIGTFHWAIKESMKIYGVPGSDGLTLATILHGYQTVVVIIVGAICFLFLIWIQRKNEKLSTSENQE